MLLESEGRGQLRCEGKWLCEGPMDEGNFVARANGFGRVFDEVPRFEETFAKSFALTKLFAFTFPSLKTIQSKTSYS